MKTSKKWLEAAESEKSVEDIKICLYFTAAR